MLFFIFFFTKNWPWGAKTATVAKLRGRFCSFFISQGQNRKFVKVKGQKLLSSLQFLFSAHNQGVLESRGLPLHIQLIVPTQRIVSTRCPYIQFLSNSMISIADTLIYTKLISCIHLIHLNIQHEFVIIQSCNK